MRKHTAIWLTALMLAEASLTGCSSTIASNNDVYFTQLSQKLAIWKDSIGAPAQSTGDSSEAASVDDGKTAVATPANWTVSEDGTYSFDGVDGAAYYIIYLYDTQSDSDSFAYMSSNIEEDGSGTYTGKLSDLFDYCYGLYDAEVVAYPAVGQSGYKKSVAAACSFSVIGEVVEPQIAYLWDCFSSTLSIELINIEDYAASSFPTEVTVTFTNAGDSSDVVTLGFENASVENGVFSASTTDASADATYAATATLTFNADVVTNSTLTVDLGDVVTASDKNAMTDGYGYLDTNVYLSMDYPMVVADFDPEAGGSVGTWYFFVNAFTTNKGVDIPITFKDCLNFQGEKGAMGADYHDGEDVYYTATPTKAVSGAEYSYTVSVAGERGVISLFDGFFWNDMPAGVGTLDLLSDGTFQMAIGAEDTGEAAGPMGPRGISDSTIEGLWVENGDGTITLSYNHATSALSE